MYKSPFKFILLMVLMAACTSPEVDAYYNFPNDTWKRFENPQINIQIDKPGIFYNMFIELVYEKNLTQEKFPITVITSTPDGEIRSRDLQMNLNEGNGVVREILRADFAFASTGICSVEIENRTQRIETTGVKKIGIILEKVE